MTPKRNLPNAFNSHSGSQKRQSKKRPSPLSIRLSENEREALQKAAAGRSINSYVKGRLFDTKKGRRKAPVEDYEALARALSLLGQSNVYTRLSALLLAIEAGKLDASTDAERDIRQACATVRSIRSDLIIALGLKA